MRSLTVVCPVYNEESAIENFHMELTAVLKGLESRYDWKALFVVDRGTDRSLDILRRLAGGDPRTQVLALTSRFGHQKSLLAGIDHCRSDVLIMMDSDGQHPPALIPELLRESERGYDIVRTRRNDPRSVGFLKRLSSRMFYRFLDSISDVKIYPNAADYRLLSHRVVRVFQEDIRERTLFLRGLISWVGFRTTSVSFETRSRSGGRSKYSLGKLFQLGMEGVIAFSGKPLRMAMGLGLGFAAIGFFLAIVTFIQYFAYGDFPSGWTTLAILIPVFSGIQLIFLGVIGEYVGAIFDEVKKRPHYIVEEKINFS